MNGTIVSFRRSVTRQKMNHLIIKVKDVSDRKKADSLVGKEVVWKNEKGTEIKGKVASGHGNSGAVRVIFERGLPGQSLGSAIQVK